MAKHDRLLELIKEHCTADQIKELLRTALGNKNVKVSAATKDELVDVNVRMALNSHSIDEDRVYELLREAEENGRQHIFYLRCTARDVVQQLSLDHVRKTLLGSTHAVAPNLEVVPEGYTIGDIRAWGRQKPSDWMVKIYGHEVREVATGEVIQESVNRILRVFERREFRHVLLARWNAPDLLELRVPQDSSTQRVLSWKAQLENTLRPVIPFERFSPWPLRNISRILFDLKDTYSNIYSLGDAELEDSNHTTIRFQSHVPDTDLFGGIAVNVAAKGLLDNNSTYRQQRVIWKAPDRDGLEPDLSTLIGSRAENEVIFSRHQNSRGIDYVTGQLRAFSKRQS